MMIKFKAGFSAIELMGSLVVAAFLVLASGRIINMINQTNSVNHYKDQVIAIRQAAIAYVTDNYRSLVTRTNNGVEVQSVVISGNTFGSYLANGVSGTLINGDGSCLYIKPGVVPNTIRSYLIFSNVDSSGKSLDYLSALKVVHQLGGNVGILVSNGQGYTMQGIFGEYLVIDNAGVDLIAANCGFTLGQIAPNAIVIDLSQNKYLPNQIKIKEDDQVGAADSKDPSLKRAGDGDLVAMQTNLYLDNIVRESQHRYHALDFANNPQTNGRITVVADNTESEINSDSELDVNNAGLVAGFVAPVSDSSFSGDTCLANEVGRIAQQFGGNNSVFGGQLQCSYNPTFCGNSGYCYLPIRGLYSIQVFSTLLGHASCPVGSRVDDTNQPPDGIAGVTCPALPHSVIIRPVHGRVTDCYSNVSGFSFCSGYQAVCTYKDDGNNIFDEEVTALAKLACTSSTATYTVNY